MKYSFIRKWITAFAAVILLSACGLGGQNIIGPRTEDAWREWHKQQELLKETWGGTEVYAYINTIRDDVLNTNANVIFEEDFSLETESPELDALKKLYEDMHYSDQMTLQEFYDKLCKSSFRWSIGGPLDLDSIEDKGNGVYAVRLLDYPSVDAMRAVDLTVKQNEDGSFRTEFE